MRADFTGITSVDAEMRLDTGEEWARAPDIPVREGATELVLALPASSIRRVPEEAAMRLTLRGSAGPARAGVVAEYVFHHEGALERNT